MDAGKNQLFFGDNLEILRSGRIPVGSVDLIYLDPSFNSNAMNLGGAPSTCGKAASRRKVVLPLRCAERNLLLAP